MFGHGKKADNITLYDLKVFSCLAEERSLSAVARRLNVPTSKVSRCIERLEDACDTELFSGDRSFRLTDRGWKLLKHNEKINSNLNTMERVVHREKNKNRNLSIFAKEHFHKIIYQALSNIGFGELAPGKGVSINSWTDDCIDELRTHNVDMVISKEVDSFEDVLSIPIAVSDSYYLVEKKHGDESSNFELSNGLVIFDFAEHNRKVHPVEEYLTRMGRRGDLKAKLSNIKHIEKRILSSGETALISSNVLLSCMSELDRFHVVDITEHYKLNLYGDKFREAIVISAHISRDSRQRALLELLAKEVRAICDQRSVLIDERYQPQEANPSALFF